MSLNKGAKRNNTAGKAIKQPQERRTPQKQTKQTQIIDTTPSSRNPEDLVEEFTDMFPDYKSLTKEEIISIFREYNNDFQAVVNSVMDQTIGTKPTESWTDVPKKKKKKGQDQPRAPKTKSDDNRAENRAQNRNRNGRDNTRNPNRTRDQPAANQNARGQPNKNRPAQPASSVPPATAPVQAAPPSLQSTGNAQAAAPQAAPTTAPPSKEAFTSHTAPLTASAPEPFTHTPSATPSTSTPTSSFARSTISYANAAKSRQPWSPHTQTAPQASSSPAQESESKKLVPDPEEPKPVVAEVPAQPVLAQPVKQSEPVVERPAPKAAPAKQPTPPREATKPAETQPAPVQPKPAPVEQKQRAGVVLPGSFVTEESMQFQFGNLGIYDEEPESAPEPIISAPVNVTKPANLSNPPAASKSAPAPTPAAASPVTAAQDYPEGISHVSNESENMIPHLPYAPNQFMPYPFDAESSRPVGHYYEAQGYPTAFPRDGKGYPGRQTGNNFGGRGDSKYTGQEPGATNTQATAQTPSAPSQGYPYHSMYPYGPFMGQFPSYSTSQFHYQPAPMGYYPAKRAYPNFGNYPSNTGMGYPEEEYKGATGYSSIPQQPGSYYMQPGEVANPGLNRDSKSQSTGQANTSKPGQSGNQQSSKPSSQSYSNAPSQDQGATNPSGAGVSNSFKASGNSNSDAYYPRDSQYGIGNTSFMSQGFYPHPQIVAQTQPNSTPYQPNRSNY